MFQSVLWLNGFNHHSNKRTIDSMKANCQSNVSSEQTSIPIDQSYVTIEQWECQSLHCSLVAITSLCTLHES